MKFQIVRATTHARCTAAIKQYGAQHPAAVEAMCALLALACVDPDLTPQEWDSAGTSAIYETYAAYMEFETEETANRQDSLGNYLRAEKAKSSLSSRSRLSAGNNTPTN